MNDRSVLENFGPLNMFRDVLPNVNCAGSANAERVIAIDQLTPRHVGGAGSVRLAIEVGDRADEVGPLLTRDADVRAIAARR